MQTLRAFALVTAGLALTGCSITQTVDPLKSAHISQVCVLDNKDVFMDDFQPEVLRQIEAKSIPAKVYKGPRPNDCSHFVEYTANWQWDMAMYLTYAEFRVYDASGLAGQAVYNARNGGGRLDKFGHTADKIRPLIDQLFASATVGSALVAPTAESTASRQPSDTAARLQQLQDLHGRGLISDDEYTSRRQAILGDI